MRIKDIMKEHPFYCIADDSALDVAIEMKRKNVGVLPVISGATTHRLIGIVTDRDLFLGVVARGVLPCDVIVRSVMTRNPITCMPESSLEYCAELMQAAQIRRVPVVDRNGSCVGMVSLGDIAPHLNPELLQKTLTAIYEDRSGKEAYELLHSHA